MKKHSLLWLTLAAMFAFAACSDDDPAKEPDNTDDEPDITLALPTQLQVSSFTHNSAILEWQRGDTNALAYDVYVVGFQDTISVEAPDIPTVTCGIDSLQHSTTYDWYARARHENVKTTWVKGPSFTTDFYDDTRDRWVGTWQGGTWDGSVTIFGMSIPYSEFSDFAPEDVDLDAMFQSMEVTITMADDPQIAMTFPQFPEASPFPGGEILLPVVDGTATYEQTIDITVPLVTDPVPIANLPFLPDDLQGNTLLDGVSLTKFTIHFTRITLVFGPQEGNALPALLTINGDVDIATNSGWDFLLFGSMDKKVSIRLTSDLIKKQE
jgi:hypothetical protein